MRRLIALALTLVSCSAAGPPARAGYGVPVLLFTFRDGAILESSGVASSGHSDHVIYTHNDSGDAARFFAVGPAGQTLATYTLARPAVALDWEDMARGPGAGGETALFFADIGNNATPRPIFQVYEVVEPPSGAGSQTVAWTMHLLVYEDAPHNAEVFLVDPVTGAFAVVTKDGPGRSGVYVDDSTNNAVASVATGPVHLLRRAATIDFDAIASPSDDFSGRLLTTGGDISPDGTRLVVRTYVEAFEWTIPESRDLQEAVAAAPTRIPVPPVRGGEAIAYTRAGDGLITTTEGANAPVHRIPVT